ncbi:MAG: hypothetical protein Q7K54_02850 [Candidatus Parcubacteria bacterium]|nr:hypothetical protein [Candidatus Parcubacteria bacterium]
MTKKIVLNIVLLFTTCIAPYFYLYISQEDSIKMESIQTPTLMILFIGSALLTYLNNKYRKHVLSYKLLWIVFEAIGILGLIYSIFVLYLLFVFRHGIGF